MTVTGDTSLEQFRGPDVEADASDRIAAPIDDNPNSEAAATIVREPAPAPEAPAVEPQEPPLAVDPRAEIAARFAARRGGEHATADNIDPNSAPIQAHAPGVPVNDNAANDNAAPAYTLKVNRQDLTVSRDELLTACEFTAAEAAGLPDSALIRIAQKNVAAQMRLDASKAPRNTLPEYAQPPQGQDNDNDLASLSEDDLTIRLQIGDTAEAAVARKELNRRDRVEADMQQREAYFARANAQAIQDFGARHPSLVNDPVAISAVERLSVFEAINDLRAIGVPEHELEGAARSVETTTAAYKAAQKQGYDLRPLGDILEATAQKVYARLNMPAPSPSAANQNTAPLSRIEMKRALPTQPVRSGATNIQQSQNTAPPPRSPSATIASMRKARFQD